MIALGEAFVVNVFGIIRKEMSFRVVTFQRKQKKHTTAQLINLLVIEINSRVLFFTEILIKYIRYGK
ncbi:hypothetical protein BMS3Abin15_00067 [bacterium BMS3Abin15]|nr:hypothetical protein BMS3Abin15_00067 [bacterium BMS3Abin15]